MQEIGWTRIIDVGLEGVVHCQKTSRVLGCVVRYITEDCMAVVIIAHDPIICDMEDVELRMFIPTEKFPIKCNGRIIKHSQDNELFKVSSGYAARVFINNISRIDMRRLDLIVAQKKAFISVSGM